MILRSRVTWRQRSCMNSVSFLCKCDMHWVIVPSALLKKGYCLRLDSGRVRDRPPEAVTGDNLIPEPFKLWMLLCDQQMHKQALVGEKTYFPPGHLGNTWGCGCKGQEWMELESVDGIIADRELVHLLALAQVKYPYLTILASCRILSHYFALQMLPLCLPGDPGSIEQALQASFRRLAWLCACIYSNNFSRGNSFTEIAL